MFKYTLKSILGVLSPGLLLEIQARRARAHSERLERRWGCSELTRKVIAGHGAKVRRGPFAGLEYTPETFHRHLTPKLLGAYESELHPVFEEVLRKEYSQILDVGAADGYYAVGLARRFPGKPVHAFDLDPWAREINHRMAALNGVDNLTIHKACHPEWLRQNLMHDAFILCDCEGYEDHLLDPEKAPGLYNCDLAVELHESISPGVTGRLRSRFERTHHLTMLGVKKRDPADFPEVLEMPEPTRRTAISELRFNDSQEWLWAKRKE